jgi:hypothetical protein
VAACVAHALRGSGIRAVLTGGACASLHSRGRYQSSDLDFILQSAVTRGRLDGVMASLGFRRNHDHYVHPETNFFVEFPAGPLGIGRDIRIKPVLLRVGKESVWTLSATDSCRDRLAAFYHWKDRQSLDVALMIARRNDVDLEAIRRWSRRENSLEAFDEFVALLGLPREARIPRRARKRRSSRPPRRP